MINESSTSGHRMIISAALVASAFDFRIGERRQHRTIARRDFGLSWREFSKADAAANQDGEVPQALQRGSKARTRPRHRRRTTWATLLYALVPI